MRRAIEFILPARRALADLKLAQGLPLAALEAARGVEAAAGGYLVWKLEAQRLRAEALAALGRAEEAEPAMRAETGAALERVATDLPDDLRASFEASPLLRRTRRD